MLGRATGARARTASRRVLVEVEVDLGGGLPDDRRRRPPRQRGARGRSTASARRCRTPASALPQRRVTVNLAPGRRAQAGAGARPADRRGAPRRGRPDPAAGDAGRGARRASWRSTARVRPVRGALPIALAARAAGARGSCVPPENAAEAALVARARRRRRRDARRLRGCAGERRRPARRRRPAPLLRRAERRGRRADLADVRGQAAARRALEIAAAGGHHLLLVGPPGAGKTMLARRLPGDPAAARRSTRRSRSRGSGAPPGSGARARHARGPFRAPHHGISLAGLDRRRRAAAPGRDHARAPRRPLPRRADRVPARCARGAAPAARGRPAIHVTRVHAERRASPRASRSWPR